MEKEVCSRSNLIDLMFTIIRFLFKATDNYSDFLFGEKSVCKQ